MTVKRRTSQLLLVQAETESLAPGRPQVVSDSVREAQGVLMTTAEAREFAVSGVVSPLPAGMPGTRVTASAATLIPGPDQGVVTAQGAAPVTAGAEPVTLSEAVREGLLRARFWPYGPCPACQDRRGRSRGSTARAWNRCPRCGGPGERIRPLARIYPRWREEHRKRRAT